MKNDISKCETCKNFIQHYIYTKETSITKTNFGHCKISGKWANGVCKNFKEQKNIENVENDLCVIKQLLEINKQISKCSLGLQQVAQNLKDNANNKI